MSDLAEIQAPPSIAEASRQAPRSMPAPRRSEMTRPREGGSETTVTQKAYVLTRVQLPESSETELEEFFEGFVTEIADTEIRLRTISSAGEEGDAWLPLTQVPRDELDFLELGVPVRVSVVVRTAPRRERAYTVRFLRPHQWYRPSADEAAPVVEYLLDKMKTALGNR